MSREDALNRTGICACADTAVDTLFREGCDRMNAGDLIDAMAFIEGALCEYGPRAAENESLVHTRRHLLKRLGRSETTPLPFELPGRLPLAGVTCGLCKTSMFLFEHSFGKMWNLCPQCRLLLYVPGAEDAKRLAQGEPAGAKQPPDSMVHHREAFFCDLFLDAMTWRSVLLYGIGWSLVPEWLRKRGISAVGCDLWQPLIDERRSDWGKGSFFHRDDLPPDRFELISAFEVFEHFTTPAKDIGFLEAHLEQEGAIVGCTDFWHGGSLRNHPSEDRAYWRHITHVTAWTFDSMREMASRLKLSVSFFKTDARGFGAKVVFVLHRGKRVEEFLRSLPKIIRGAF